MTPTNLSNYPEIRIQPITITPKPVSIINRLKAVIDILIHGQTTHLNYKFDIKIQQWDENKWIDTYTIINEPK